MPNSLSSSLTAILDKETRRFLACCLYSRNRSLPVSFCPKFIGLAVWNDMSLLNML
jgi:hypothetical protein